MEMTNIFCSCEVYDLVKSLPAVIFSDWVSFLEADMVVGGYQDADGVGICVS